MSQCGPHTIQAPSNHRALPFQPFSHRFTTLLLPIPFLLPGAAVVAATCNGPVLVPVSNSQTVDYYYAAAACSAAPSPPVFILVGYEPWPLAPSGILPLVPGLATIPVSLAPSLSLEPQLIPGWGNWGDNLEPR